MSEQGKVTVMGTALTTLGSTRQQPERQQYVCVWQWAWDLEPPAAAFPKKAEELDLLAGEAALEEDIVYPGQQPWLNRQ